MTATYTEGKVLEAFLSGLNSLSLGYSIAWPNVNFTPTAGAGYLRASLLPAQSDQVTLGTAGRNRLRGLFQVAVVWPQGKGEVAPMDLAGRIIAGLKRGTIITNGGINVRVLSPPYVAPPVQEPDWVNIPVYVPYIADADNPS
jgi:hypothetical protein